VTAREMVRLNVGLDRPARSERDPDAPCPSDAFEPGAPSGDCDTDGHYMCSECVHCRPGVLEERRGGDR
jgi:hypothetical protein